MRLRVARAVASAGIAGALLAACSASGLAISPRAGSVGTQLNTSVEEPLRGEKFELTGSVSTAQERDVSVQVYDVDTATWAAADVPRVTTNGSGGFVFPDVSIAEDTIFRVRTVGSDDPVVTRSIEVTYGGTRQDGALRTLPKIAGPSGRTPQAASQSSGLVVARFTPARPGRAVTFEQRTGDTWTTAGETKQDDEGYASVVVSDPSEPDGWRATTQARDGLAATTTEPRKPTDWSAELVEDFTSTDQPAEWSHRLTDRWLPQRVCGYVTPSQVTFPGEVARFSTQVLKKKPSGIKGTPVNDEVFKTLCKDGTGEARYYAGSMMLTGTDAEPQTYTYGVAAARIKFDERAGQHAAFWLQTNSNDDTEIDVVESFGAGRLLAGLHVTRKGVSLPVQKRIGGSISPMQDDDWYDRYHVYSVEWTPSEYVFRVDGREEFRTARGISDEPHYVVLSNFAADYEVRNNNGERASMSVDWVRFWQ